MRLLLILSLAFIFPACALDNLFALYTRYTPVPSEYGIVRKDILYRPNGDPKKNALDLYLPGQKNPPLIIFVHGGSWNSGDKGMKALGRDIYGNIGRYYQSKGYAVAVINYRLIPHVTWKEQAQDVVQAIHFLYANPQRKNYDMNRIYLMGHSAGAQIILKMATDPRYLNKVGDTPTLFQGVIVLSPPAVDLSQDPATSIAEGPSLAKRTFGLGDNWRTEAAVIPWIKNPKVPFLVLTGAKELKYFHQQSDLLIRGFEKNGVTYQSYEIKGLTHVGMILAASQDGMVADRILKFLKETKNTR